MSFIKLLSIALQTLTVLLAITAVAPLQAQTRNCKAIAEMAKDIANIRDMGVPLSAVQQRLRRDIKDQNELVMGLVAAKIVYATRGTGEQLRQEVLMKCGSTL